MIDETTGTQWNAEPNAPQAEPTPETAGFCQDCGKPLTAETRRTVGSGVFCEPCLQVRLNAGVPPPAASTATGTMPPLTNAPNPTTAGWLGLIPGVGAMYNGQFAKGIAHFVIFAVLSSLGDRSGFFKALAFGWIIYQVFDAIHTARARRDGLPLPNTFGLNDIGERFAAGRWHSHTPNPNGAGAPPPPPTGPAATGWQPVTPPPPAAVYPPPAAAQANWAGYVPPTAFGGTAAPYVAPPAADPVYTGHDAWTAPPVSAGIPVAKSNGFPTAAIVLIIIGVLFLFANVFPSFHLDGDWTAAIILAACAAWSLFRRLAAADQIRATTEITGGSYFIGVFRWPITLAVFALLFVLQAAHIATWGQTWPLMLITAGVLTFLDRAAAHAAPPPAWPGNYPPAAPVTTTEIATTEKEEAR